MNIKIIEKSLLPFFFAIIFIIAFYWQFITIYAFLIEHFANEKLSVLYAHLFIYSFLVFTLFLFAMNILNTFLIKSKVFIATIALSLLVFYALGYEVFLSNLTYFMGFALSIYATMFMVLFVVSTFIYGLYSLIIVLFQKFPPLSHSFVFLLIGLIYGGWFIHVRAYPLHEIMTKF